jgi:hypothetical protein
VRNIIYKLLLSCTNAAYRGGCSLDLSPGRRGRDQQLNYNLVSVSSGHISPRDTAFAETDFEMRY